MISVFIVYAKSRFGGKSRFDLIIKSKRLSLSRMRRKDAKRAYCTKVVMSVNPSKSILFWAG